MSAERVEAGALGVEQLLERAAGAAVLVDGGGRVVAANGAAREILGWEAGSGAGQRLGEIEPASRRELEVFELPAVRGAPVVAELERELERYRDLATRDYLTGIQNRRAIQAALTREIARAVRYGGPVSVALADLNGLKMINDSFGHFAGDAVLRAVAQRLQERVRRADLVGRWGGDEFLLLLPQTDLEHALRAVAAFEHAVAEAPVDLPFGGQTRVSICAGVVEWAEQEGDEVEPILIRADAALYEAKGETHRGAR